MAAHAGTEGGPQARRAHRRRQLAARRRAVRRRIHAEADARACRSSAASSSSCCCSTPTVEDLLRGDVRDIVTSIVAALHANPPALAAFAMAVLIVLVGGSILTFVVKGGTVALLVEAERIAPARSSGRRCGSRRSGARIGRRDRSIPRRLSAAVAAVRPARPRPALRLRADGRGSTSGSLFGGYALADNLGVLLGWTVCCRRRRASLIVWITLVNFLYLITQMVMAVEDVGRARARSRLVVRFLRSSRARNRGGSSASCCCSSLLATAASILATAGLGLIAFRAARRPGRAAAAARRVAACAASSSSIWR